MAAWQVIKIFGLSHKATLLMDIWILPLNTTLKSSILYRLVIELYLFN